MLLATEQKIAEIIIHCFRGAPRLSAREIAARVAKVRRVTDRAVFKELAKLVDQGVLVRLRGRYAVKVTWLLELLQLGDDLKNQSLRRESLDFQVPKPGQRLRWRFRDLRRMDAFWVQLMFVLFSVSSSKRMYVWSPHFWFHLLDLKKELQAMRAMRTGGNKHYLIIGADTYVDRLPARYWNKAVYEWSFAPGPFEGETRRYVDVIDDFVLTVLFPAHFAAELDALCARIRSDRELAAADLKAFFDRPALTTLTLEHNAPKARRLRKKFAEYFGHPRF